MNILMLTARMGIGGAETHILSLSRGLVERGYSVTVGSAGGVYEEEFPKYGISAAFLPLDSVTSLLKAVKMLKKLLKQERFDVIHAHGRLSAFAAFLTLKNNKCNIPLVTTAHLNYQVNPIVKRFSVWGERTLAVSPAIGDYLQREYHLSEKTVENTVNGIDTSVFFPEKPDSDLLSSFRLMENNFYRAVMVSRLDKNADAGVWAILEALPFLIRALPSLELILCGGGDDEQRIRERAEAINCSAGKKAVILTGPRTDIAKIMNLASIGFGVSRAAMEEMACGKPVFLIGPQGCLGIFDKTKEEKAAETNFCCMNFLPQPETIAEEAMKLFLLSEEERNKLGEYGKNLIHSRYTVDKMTSDAERIYRAVLKAEK